MDAANKVNEAVAKIMRACHDEKIQFTVENPRSSYMWNYPAIEKAMEDLWTRDVDFQACMYGAKRDKWTRLVTNEKGFCRMAKVCDGSHKHEPWGQVWSDGKWTWATKLECEYSAGLCEAIAEEATKNLSGHILPTPKPQIARKPPGRDPRLTEVRAAAGRQTRHAHRTNVPNQKKATTLSFDVDYHTDLIPGKIKQDTIIGPHTIPKGSVVESVAQKKVAKGGSDT